MCFYHRYLRACICICCFGCAVAQTRTNMLVKMLTCVITHDPVSATGMFQVQTDTYRAILSRTKDRRTQLSRQECSCIPVKGRQSAS